MRKGLPSHRRIKIHRSYVVEEIAGLLGVHKNTVRQWVKSGLSPCDDRRPILIQGRDLVSFLQARRARNKRHCRPGEMYCVRCRAPKLPAGDMAEYQWLTEKCGNLIGICPDCLSMMNRRVSVSKLALVCGRLEITLPQALQRVSESIHSTVNSDLREETQSRANAQCQ
ncbi:MAG: DNA-binding protein [Candidatus Angelobacter sp. Gp1-AA117]|nr:MAG: DNA-binding protein [Candidatus Angelobacter sp. Gp1-AA117]